MEKFRTAFIIFIVISIVAVIKIGLTFLRVLMEVLIGSWEKVVFLSVNPFVPNASFLYALKTLETLTVFSCFRGVEKGCIGSEWVYASL